MTGEQLKAYFKKKNINISSLSTTLSGHRGYFVRYFKLEKVPDWLIELLRDKGDIDIADLRKFADLKNDIEPLEYQKDIPSGVVNESEQSYTSTNYREQYYTCLEESGKLKSRLIEVLEENRELRIKITN